MHPFDTRAARVAILVVQLFFGAAATSALRADVPVFILAGQSNMQGQASLVTLKHQIVAERTRDQFAHLHDGHGEFRVRDDVFIHFFDRHGKLEVGYGAPDRFGPELGFGWTVGEAMEQPVLIIKVAYGGRSLFRDFRSPSAGLPADEVLQRDLEQLQKQQPTGTLDDVKASYGASYRELVDEVRKVQAGYREEFPELADESLRLAGFVWFQGWNDMISDQYSAAYSQNLAHFIRDVRRDLNAATLPFIIGQMGVDGPYRGDDASSDKKEIFKSRQAEAADRPEFAGNVAVVTTEQYWDPVADKAFQVWREDVDAWRHHGNDFPYHYLGSPKIIYEIGEAFGQQMLRMLPEE